MSEEYEESCDECGFNQKDEDERDKQEKQELISEFVEKLLKIEENRLIKDYPVFENLLFLINEYQEKLQ